MASRFVPKLFMNHINTHYGMSLLLRNCSVSTKYTPRRAVLYVPGNDERKINKISSLGSDCVVLDCEDGVAVNMKEQARNTICDKLDTIEFGRSESCVRINSISSGIFEDDLNVILNAKTLPSALMLPKVEDIEDLERFASTLDDILESKKIIHNFKLLIFIESAKGLLNIKDICTKGVSLTEISSFDFDGIVFGSDDFCADIGATRTSDAKELLLARQTIALHAKAHRLHAIDMVDNNYKDLDSLKTKCLDAAQMGYTGKQVIHPNQIPIVHEAFSPSAEKIEWAVELVKAFNEQQECGKGAFEFRGHMIDRPLLLQAQNILSMVENLKQES